MPGGLVWSACTAVLYCHHCLPVHCPVQWADLCPVQAGRGATANTACSTGWWRIYSLQRCSGPHCSPHTTQHYTTAVSSSPEKSNFRPNSPKYISCNITNNQIAQNKANSTKEIHTHLVFKRCNFCMLSNNLDAHLLGLLSCTC